MALLLADGQLEASAATLLGTASSERIVALTLFNTSGTEQIVTLLVTRSGSTARTVARVALKKKYTSAYISGLPLDPSDVLSGYASGGAAVDYLVTTSSGPFAILMRDEDGAPQASSDVTLSTTEKTALSVDGIVLSGLLEEVRDLLLKIA